MIHITKYLVSIKLHFVCFLIGFLLFMNIFYFYYFILMAKRNRESPLKCLQDLVNVIKQDQITRALYLPNLHRASQNGHDNSVISCSTPFVNFSHEIEVHHLSMRYNHKHQRP